MKKAHIFAYGFLLSMNAIAQPTLTGNHVNAQIGEQYEYYLCSYQSDGSNLPNQIWDFSNLSPIGGSTLVSFSNSDAAHPGTNIKSTENGVSTYFQNNANSSNAIYQEINGLFIHYTNPFTFLTFPLSAATSESNNFTAVSTGTTTATEIGTNLLQYRSYGTVITPAGTFTDCLKIRLFSSRVPAVTSTDTSDVIYWFKAGIHVPILSCHTLYDDGDTIQFSIYSDPSTLNSEEKVRNDFSIYPNPVTNELTIQTITDFNAATVNIYALNGQIVLTTLYDFANPATTISTEGLKKGIYFLEIDRKDGASSRQKFIKQ